MNTSTFSQKGLFACTFFLPISLFETVSDIWFYVFLHSPSCCCCCALAKLYSTLCDTRTIARQASLSSAISQNLLKLMSIESVMPSNRLILCRPLLLLPSIFPSIKVFSSESALRIRWPKYWSLSFSISPFNEYSGLISSRTDCFDLLTVQRTVLLNSYLGIIFIFLIIPVVLGCHPLLILLWCVTLFVGPKRNHIPQSNPPCRISTLHPLSDGDAVCYPHAFGSWFSRCRLWPVDLLEQIT